MVSDKDYRSVVREVCRGVSYQRVTVTQVEGGRMLPAVELAEEFLTQGQKYVYVSPNSRDAFEEALSRRDDSVLYCAGSLYLAGAIESILHKDFLPEGS